MQIFFQSMQDRKVLSLPYDFLDNIFFSLLCGKSTTHYLLQYIMLIAYTIDVNQLFVISEASKSTVGY